jgi:hypothetical protein
MENLVYGLVVLLGYTQFTLMNFGEGRNGLECFTAVRGVAMVLRGHSGVRSVEYSIESGESGKVLVYRIGSSGDWGVIDLASREIEGMWGVCGMIDEVRLEGEWGFHEIKRKFF